MMKKLWTGILAAVLALSIGPTAALAAEPQFPGGRGRHHADGHVRCADADGSGVCDICGAALPLGAGFVDADGDGICDNFGSDTCRGGYCGGAGRQGGGRGGRRR